VITVGILSELNNEAISGGNFSIHSKFLGTFICVCVCVCVCISGGRDALRCRPFLGKGWEIGYMYLYFTDLCIW
jgi:hypothetical protein